MFFANWKLYLIIIALVTLIIGGLSTALYFSNKALEGQSGKIAQLTLQVEAAQKSIKTLQDDALITERNQTELFGQLDDIRTASKEAENKPAVPPKIAHGSDAAPITKYINEQTKITLHQFEVLTRHVKK